MDPSISEFLKVYGPLGLGWVFYAIERKRGMDREEKETEAKVKLAVAIESLTNLIKDRDRDHG